ncbi:cytochrome c3 family protein [Seleniivibrio sp.]|uniref:cytochrome c3 family protein n=1 Tax=Seleniivibrio sp. TaxID=2898801 RepID=UPI0025FBB032|nr:cytochrome c3 family protein [Seleniivibrio sp.]MCD8554992.1 hypothetical protein [Seleniivibrio sp.]
MKKIYKVLTYITVLCVIALTVACGGGNSGDMDSPLTERTGNAPQLTVPEAHYGGTAWGNDKCYLCHNIKKLQDIHDYSPKLAASFGKVGETDIGACLYCHGTNGIKGITADTYQCLKCHADSDIVSSHDMFGGSNMHDLDGDGKIGNSDCVVCHDWSDMDGTLDLAVDLTQSGTTYASTNNFCLNCHDGNGAFSIMPSYLTFDTEQTNIYATFMGIGSTDAEMKSTADIHGAKVGQGQSFGVFRGTYANDMVVPCLSCHQVHSSDNPYLITESGKTATLADDTAKSASVSVTTNNFSELCAVCHTNDSGADTTNGLKEVVHTSTYSSNCTDCHYHGAGYGTNVNGLF